MNSLITNLAGLFLSPKYGKLGEDLSCHHNWSCQNSNPDNVFLHL